jgi:FlaA1/EpsC-like NDP-sugar epimerase
MFVISRLYYAPGKMGFFPDVHITRYFLPLECFEEKKKIVLYGAGAVGKDYYNQLTKRSDCEVVLWVDKNWKMHTYRFLPVKSITKVSTVKYDYIVIAIKKIETANVIKEELVNSGIEADKILWKEPVNINMM